MQILDINGMISESEAYKKSSADPSVVRNVPHFGSPYLIVHLVVTVKQIVPLKLAVTA